MSCAWLGLHYTKKESGSPEVRIFPCNITHNLTTASDFVYTVGQPCSIAEMESYILRWHSNFANIFAYCIVRSVVSELRKLVMAVYIASRLAESGPYCHSGCLSVCMYMSVGHSSTYSLPWLIDHNQIWYAGTYLSSHGCSLSLFGSPVPHTLGSRWKNMENFAYFQL